jgi:hypothetical protein
VTRQRRRASAADASAPLSGPGTLSPDLSTGVSPKPALTLDALGKKCPIPIIMLADRIREIRMQTTPPPRPTCLRGAHSSRRSSSVQRTCRSAGPS